MHTERLCLVIVCLTVASSISLVAGQSDFETVPSTESAQRGPTRAALTLYCNITGPCKPCKQHMQAEACKQTGHAEKLTCVTNSEAAHQVALRIHRRINTSWQPLHISRSCPANTAAAAAGASSSTPAPAPAAPASEVGITQHESDPTIGESSSSRNKPHPRQVYFEGSRTAGVGGLNVLYFELGVLVVLSGALPVVYIRKRRYVRL